MVMWYWPVDILFWEVSVDHNMGVQYQKATLQTEDACLCQLSWSMVTILCPSTVAVVHTRPRAIPLAMIAMIIKRGFPFLSYMGMGLRY